MPKTPAVPLVAAQIEKWYSTLCNLEEALDEAVTDEEEDLPDAKTPPRLRRIQIARRAVCNAVWRLSDVQDDLSADEARTEAKPAADPYLAACGISQADILKTLTPPPALGGHGLLPDQKEDAADA